MTYSGATVQASWAQTRERGTLFLMRLMFVALRITARPVMLPIVRLIALYFLLFGPGGRTRAASLDYLQRVQRQIPSSGLKANRRCAYRHFVAFSDAILDKLDAWTGRLNRNSVTFANYGDLRALADSGRGVLVIGSHLGNLEVCRALASMTDRVKLNVLVHTKHADRFNRIMRMAGATDLHLIQVTSMDAALALTLKERIDRGEWVVIAGDRVPVHGGRTVDVHFFGSTAPMPLGPYVLASVLECPVYLLFCLRRTGRNWIYLEHFADRVQWRRSERDAVIATLAQRFANRLEHYLRLEPLQWFNFYPFWRDSSAA
jgi:predicted LPLAT superfamily acyltransferase